MSLYDSFFSDLNKDHVYNQIKDIVLKNDTINIFLDGKFREIFENNIKSIYDSNNDMKDLDSLNNLVINEMLYKFKDKINECKKMNRMIILAI